MPWSELDLSPSLIVEARASIWQVFVSRIRIREDLESCGAWPPRLRRGGPPCGDAACEVAGIEPGDGVEFRELEPRHLIDEASGNPGSITSETRPQYSRLGFTPWRQHRVKKRLCAQRSGSESSIAVGLSRHSNGATRADAFKGGSGGEGPGAGRLNSPSGGLAPGRGSDLPAPGRAGQSPGGDGRRGPAPAALVRAPLRRSAPAW